MRWFAVSVGLDSHPKTYDLRGRLKDKKAEVYVLRLMSWLAQTENEQGFFRDAMVAEDVARWDGEPGALVSAMVGSGFLEQHPTGFIVHGWEKWNGPHLRKARNDRSGPGENTARNPRGIRAENPPTHLPTHLPTDVPPIPPKGASVEGFETFWAGYPKKVGKEAARKAWKRLRPDARTRGLIACAVAHQSRGEQWRKEHGRFIPNPATWLNQGRWDDEPVKTTAQAEEELRDARMEWEARRRGYERTYFTENREQPTLEQVIAKIGRRP